MKNYKQIMIKMIAHTINIPGSLVGNVLKGGFDFVSAFIATGG